MLEEERKVGLVLLKESAEGRERIWAEYLEKMVQAGQIAPKPRSVLLGPKKPRKEFRRSCCPEIAERSQG